MTALDVVGAMKLAEELLAIGQSELAVAINNAAYEARRPQTGRT